MRILEHIKQVLFADYEAKLRREFAETLEKETKKVLKEYKKTHTVADMVRERLNIYHPRRLIRNRVDAYDMRSEHHILEKYKTEEEERIFLSEVHTLNKNSALRSIVDHLLEEQIMYIAMDAKDDESITLAQHNINGILLIPETVESLEVLYQELKLNAPREEEEEED